VRRERKARVRLLTLLERRGRLSRRGSMRLPREMRMLLMPCRAAMREGYASESLVRILPAVVVRHPLLLTELARRTPFPLVSLRRDRDVA